MTNQCVKYKDIQLFIRILFLLSIIHSYSSRGHRTIRRRRLLCRQQFFLSLNEEIPFVTEQNGIRLDIQDDS